VSYVGLKHGWHNGVHDAGWGIPYLALMGSLALQSKTPMNKRERSSGQRTVGLLIDNLSQPQPAIIHVGHHTYGSKDCPGSPMVGLCLYFGGGCDLWSKSSDIAGEACQVARGVDQGDDCNRRGEPCQEPIPGQHEP
jgi:hypothetical protein